MLWAAATLLGVILTAMAWAKARQPLKTEDFIVRSPAGAEQSGVVVRPADRQIFPVVVYLHGSGDSLERSTRTLRQFAELGLAAVCVDYTQTNAASFPLQFDALLSWIASQAWADTNRMAWVGFSLGAQRMLSYGINHPDVVPPFLVRVAGGRVPELDWQPPRLRGKAWLVHGEMDETFRLSEAEEVRRILTMAGMSVDMAVIPGQTHSFGENQQLVLRLIAERCARELKVPPRKAIGP